MELAVATHTSPGAWRDEDDATLATALDVLDRVAQEVNRHG